SRAPGPARRVPALPHHTPRPIRDPIGLQETYLARSGHDLTHAVHPVARITERRLDALRVLALHHEEESDAHVPDLVGLIVRDRARVPEQAKDRRDGPR